MAIKRDRQGDPIPPPHYQRPTGIQPQWDSMMPLASYYNQVKSHAQVDDSRYSFADFKDTCNRGFKGSELSGRTFKRHRDNRPDEAEIHASTINKLFSAQTQPHRSPSPPMDLENTDHEQPADADADVDMDMDMDIDLTTAPPQQTSNLHHFWSLPGRPREEPPRPERQRQPQVLARVQAHAQQDRESFPEPECCKRCTTRRNSLGGQTGELGSCACAICAEMSTR